MGYTLVLKACSRPPLAGPSQGDTLFSTIASYLAAAQGFAQLQSGALTPPEDGQVGEAAPHHLYP